MDRYIRINKVDSAGLPIRAKTCYKWHSIGKYPELFKKFGGFLFLDLKTLEALIAAGGKNN